MEHQIELGYLVLEVPDPGRLAPVFADVVGLVPGEPTAAGADTWRNDRARTPGVRPGRAGERRRRDRSRGRGRRRVRRASSPGCRASVPTSPTVTAATDGCSGSFARRRRGASTSRSSCSWPTRRAPFSSRSGAGRLPHRRRRLRTRRLRHDGVRGVRTRSSPTVSGSVNRTGSRPSSRPGIDLEVRFYHCNGRHHTVALARAPFELPQRLHHVMFETQRARRRRRRLRPRLGDRPRHPERARPPRQRRHVQLLPADAGRVPGRGRPRRPGDHGRLGRQPPLRPDQRCGATSRCARHERRRLDADVAIVGYGPVATCWRSCSPSSGAP